MNQHEKDLLRQAAELAAKSGAPRLSVDLVEAMLCDAANRQHFERAREVADECGEAALVAQLDEVLRQLPGAELGVVNGRGLARGWYTDHTSRSGTAHFYPGLAAEGFVTALCGREAEPEALQVEATGRCARCAKWAD